MILSFAASLSVGHNSLVIPFPRNAMDGSLPAMKAGGHVDGGLTCTCTRAPCPMGKARAKGGAGQPCLWWSQGCSIGCDFCLTDPNHPANGGKIPTTPITGNAPHADKAGFRKSYCEAPKVAAFLPKKFWTLNMHAVDGAVNDSYRFNPWRAPGHAPVVDPCGQAGGKYLQTPMGGASDFGTVNVTTPSGEALTLRMGDLGSKVLPPTADAEVATWHAGSTPRVAWGMRFNHGGGYQYRLCPLTKMPCTESEFQEMPLDFVREHGAHAIMWNNGTLRPIKGVFVDDTVLPAGSHVVGTWARNPIPRIHQDNVGMAWVGKCLQYSDTDGSGSVCNQTGAPWCNEKEDCQQFPNPCPELDIGWFGPGANATHMPTSSSFPFLPDSNQHEGWCSGDWTLGMVSDKVVVPADLAPGRYVLSWRMDCEETAQIWQNCADVNVVANK